MHGSPRLRLRRGSFPLGVGCDCAGAHMQCIVHVGARVPLFLCGCVFYVLCFSLSACLVLVLALSFALLCASPPPPPLSRSLSLSLWCGCCRRFRDDFVFTVFNVVPCPPCDLVLDRHGHETHRSPDGKTLLEMFSRYRSCALSLCCGPQPLPCSAKIPL